MYYKQEWQSSIGTESNFGFRLYLVLKGLIFGVLTKVDRKKNGCKLQRVLKSFQCTIHDICEVYSFKFYIDNLKSSRDIGFSKS